MYWTFIKCERKILIHEYATKLINPENSPLPHEIRTLVQDRKAWKHIEVDCGTTGNPMSSSAEERDWHFCVLPFVQTPTYNWWPCEQTLLSGSSWLKRRQGGSAWIVSSLWSYRSLKFWTSQSCFFSSNCFFECKHLFIYKPLVITEPTVPSPWLLGLGLKLYPHNM